MKGNIMDDNTTQEQMRVLRDAARALKAHDRLKAALREQEAHLTAVSRAYGETHRIWGFRPEHLRQACVARGLLA
jgi:P2-related tail formation protein